MQEATSTRPLNAVELTFRGVIIGGLITLVFTAANVYLGLKVGLTFASSIPAAVISMAVLRAFKNSTIYENNIVQTVASAAGTLSAIIFVLPGLVIVHWWTGFPFWESFFITLSGGVLGVMYSVPLRRALVTGTDLPFPEGVAAAEVLRVGAGEKSEEFQAENKLGLLALIWSSIVSAFVQVLVGIGLLAGSMAKYVKVGIGSVVTGMGFGTSLALVGAGHLIGLTVGLSIGAGLAIAFFILIPIISYFHPPAATDAATIANTIRGHDVRFIGAGVIGIAAIWALARLVGPVIGGIRSSLASSKARKETGVESLPITERDLPISTVVISSVIAFIPIGVLLFQFLNGGVLQSMMLPLIAIGLLYIVVVGFFIAATAGYMAALIGASNSPVSGMGILSVIGASFILAAMGRSAAPSAGPALVAFALFVTAILLNVATISNDNLQDLKTGQLVDATPWRQQVALVFGVLFGSLVIPVTLNLLNGAYGFGDNSALGAPQAHLIAALAQGVIQGTIDWGLIGWGVLIGVVVIVIDEIGRVTGKFRFPPMAVGLGVYLPPEATAPVVVGAVMGKLYNNWVEMRSNPAAAKRLGVLIASGLIVGESLWGVFNAGLVSIAQSGVLHVGDPSNPLAIPLFSNLGGVAMILAVIAFLGFPIGLYKWIGDKAKNL